MYIISTWTQYFKLEAKHTCEGVTLLNIRRRGITQRTVNRKRKPYHLLAENITWLIVL